MFVIFRRRGDRLHAVVAEGHRVGGRVQQRHIASLGAVGAPPSEQDRLEFWSKVPDRLARLGNKITAEDQMKILGALHERMPTVLRPADYIEAERRADLVRKEARAPPALPWGSGEGRPYTAAFFTLLNIDKLHRIALYLATGDLPAEECEAILASLPVELREDFRRIVGRHRRFGRRRSLSREEVKELVDGIAELRDSPNRKPDGNTWTPEEMSKFDRVRELRRAQFGPSTARKIDEFGRDALATWNVHILEGPPTPAYLGRLWEGLDEWGAKQHNTTLEMFRSWRTRRWKELSIGRPPHRGQAKRVRDK